MSRDESMAVLFAGLSETHPGDVGPAYESIARRDDAWWFGLKKSLGQYKPYQSVVYLPPGYSPNGGKHWPLILFLHGGNPQSESLDFIRTQGLCAFAISDPGLPFVIISPASPPGWFSTASLDALLDEVLKNYDVDPDRVYVTGLSLGGFGTWDLAAESPDRFAAAVPIASYGDPNDAQRLKNLPIWAFQGSADPVPVQADKDCIAAVRAAGGRVNLTIYPGVGHDSWDRTYHNLNLYPWLLKQRRGAPELAPVTDSTTQPSTQPAP
jgi:predicted peptidase